jgi:hypothetical protein
MRTIVCAAALVIAAAIGTVARAAVPQSDTGAATAVAAEARQLTGHGCGKIIVHAYPRGTETFASIAPHEISEVADCEVVISPDTDVPFASHLSRALADTQISRPTAPKAGLDCRVECVFYDLDGKQTLSVVIDTSSGDGEINGMFVHLNSAVADCVYRDLAPLLDTGSPVSLAAPISSTGRTSRHEAHALVSSNYTRDATVHTTPAVGSITPTLEHTSITSRPQSRSDATSKTTTSAWNSSAHGTTTRPPSGS